MSVMPLPLRSRSGPGLLGAMRRRRGLILAAAVAFPAAFHLLLLAALVLRFGNVPNYMVSYDWLANVWRIVASTAALSDVLSIASNEWLLEIGYMNHAFGKGVAEWSLAIIPHKVLILAGVGALVGLNLALTADQEPGRTVWQDCARSVCCGLTTGLGALAASITSITLSWVVCHSGPSWVVSLAILGIDVSTSIAVEPAGPALSLAGAALLVATAVLIARHGAATIVASSPNGKALPC